MPKKGVFLTLEASKKIKSYLKQNNLSQEEFAEGILDVSSKTLRNWLGGKNSVDLDALDIIIDKLGIGINDLLGDMDCDKYNCTTGVASTVREIYSNHVAIYIEQSYRRITGLFNDHISFLKFPKHGYFKTFEHDPNNSKNFYFEFHIKLEEEIEEVKFTIGFTISKIRIDYGEINIGRDKIDIVQFFQPPNYSVKRIDKKVVRVVTYLDETPHIFIVSSDVPFELEKKGKISEEDLDLPNLLNGQASDIVVFLRHFFFH